MRDNTLLFYCGDNGTSADGSLVTPHRDVQGAVYDGGILVPGLIEWPARIPRPRRTKIRASTSDLLPALCSIVGQPLPARPIDGIDLELQKGTTPLVKLMGGIATRNFKNFRDSTIKDADYLGARAIIDGRFKLVIHGEKNGEPLRELFDLKMDRSEKNNLIGVKPSTAEKLGRQLHQWQHSVLNSLTGADYRK